MDNKYYRDEEVFSFVDDFQSQLPKIMKICNWDNHKLASLLSISVSSVNNYLGNASMTNEKRSSMSEPQFITLLLYMQRKVEEQKSFSMAITAFTYLCPGISKLDEEKLRLLTQNETNEVPKDIICTMYANWFPAAVRNLNTFVDWQSNGKNKSLYEYKGVDHVTALYDDSPVSKEEIQLAEKNAYKVIPLYLKMFMSEKKI